MFTHAGTRYKRALAGTVWAIVVIREPTLSSNKSTAFRNFRFIGKKLRLVFELKSFYSVKRTSNRPSRILWIVPESSLTSNQKVPETI
jgi:hypothetical protein